MTLAELHHDLHHEFADIPRDFVDIPHDFEGLADGEGREDQYETVRFIGSGSFGQVFLVSHKSERKHYVMKRIACIAAMDASKQEATELEVRLLREMRHPNIVAYTESFMTREGHLCIVMEFCQHGDLCTYLQDAKKVNSMPDEPRLVDWFIQISLALHALHLRKILHRDLKTQNIFLTGKPPVYALKLGDFGIAKVLDSTTDLAKTQIGTPFYMSPELINNKPYSYKSDIWGLGCVFYEIVNGQRAFDAQSLNGLALKIIRGNYTPITASCSEATKSVIKQMLSKHPKHRPTIKELLHMPSIRRQIPQAFHTVVTASPYEDAQLTEKELSDHLVMLGLGGVLNLGADGPTRDRRRLQQRLEKAERRKKKEEMALQQTALLLEQCLRDHPTRRSPSPSPNSSRPGLPDNASMPESSWREFTHREEGPSFQGDPWPQTPEDAPLDTNEETLIPAVSHPRANPRRDASVSFYDAGQDGTLERSRKSAHGRSWHSEGSTSVAMMLADHIHEANHLQPTRSNIGTTPRRTSRNAEPSPPPLPYNEPLPPGHAPPANFVSSAFRTPSDRARVSKTMSLKALPSDQRSHTGTELGEDSECSSGGSLSEEREENISDVSSSSWLSDKREKRSKALQQRLDHQTAAVERRRMTIDMLQYSLEQQGFEVQDSGEPPRGPKIARAPAVVQDSIARLSRRCLEGLGFDKFQAAKRCLQASLDAAEVPACARGRMVDVLGVDRIGFFSLIDQIVHMERRWGSEDLS